MGSILRVAQEASAITISKNVILARLILSVQNQITVIPWAAAPGWVAWPCCCAWTYVGWPQWTAAHWPLTGLDWSQPSLPTRIHDPSRSQPAGAACIFMRCTLTYYNTSGQSTRTYHGLCNLFLFIFLVKKLSSFVKFLFL